MTQTFTAIEHTDVRGNVLYYIKLKMGEKEHLINVGKKTHDAVKNLLETANQTELPLDELNTKKDEVDNNNNKGGRRNGGNTSSK